ncbi:MAG: hypothetical protein WBO97_02165, partial [Tepidiformaceae bacterium]
PRPADGVPSVEITAASGSTVAKGVDASSLASLHIDIGPGRRAAVLRDPATSDEIRQVLEDGVITFPEYEASVLAMAACVRDAGGVFSRPDQPRLSWRGLYTYSTGFPEAVPGAQAAVSGCVDRHVGILDLFWKELVSPSAKDIADAMAAMALCMRDNGLGTLVPESMAPQDFQKIVRTIAPDESKLRAYVGCAKSAENEFGLIGFAPYTVDAP